MKTVSLSKVLLLASSILVLTTACNYEKKVPPAPKGPEQEPFQNCDCIDCECEEGASSDAMKKEAEPTFQVVTPIVVEEASPVVQKTEQKPAPIEAKQEESVPAPAITTIVETAPVMSETVSAQKLETAEETK